MRCTNITWPTSSQISGTMGGVDAGVQRANKFRSEQITEADVILKNPDFQNIIQSDQFQKLLKNEDFVKMAADGRLNSLVQSNFITLMTDVNLLMWLINRHSKK